MSPSIHLHPINVVVSNDPQGRSNLVAGFVLRCFQHLSDPDVDTQRCTWPDPLKLPAPATDRDRTVSRRSEPSSRAALMGEQPNPWDLLQPQDATSRHRGAKPFRRCELLGMISLLSPEYLLSFERRPFHAEPPDHYAPVSCLDGLSASQSSALVPLHSAAGYQSA